MSASRVLALWGGLAAAAQPNFVWYFPDEVQAASLGTYGHPVTQTPNFDRLAAEGTKFTQHHVLHTQCA
jgi:arylsulfatase A-like enzyme